MNPPIKSEILPPWFSRPFCHAALRLTVSRGGKRIPSTEINGLIGVGGGHGVWTRVGRRLRRNESRRRGGRPVWNWVFARVLLSLLPPFLDASSQSICRGGADRRRGPFDKWSLRRPCQTRRKTERKKVRREIKRKDYTRPRPATRRFSRCPGTPARHKAARVSLIRVDRVLYTVLSIPPLTTPGPRHKRPLVITAPEEWRDGAAQGDRGTRDTSAQTSQWASGNFGRKRDTDTTITDDTHYVSNFAHYFEKP